MRVSCNKFLHFDIYLIVVFLYHQSDFLSIYMSVSVKPRLSCSDFLCPACRNLVGLGPGATPFHITIRGLQVCIGLHIRASSDIKRQSDSRCQCSCDGRLRQWDPLCSAYLHQDVKSCLVIVKLKQLFNDSCSICV